MSRSQAAHNQIAPIPVEIPMAPTLRRVRPVVRRAINTASDEINLMIIAKTGYNSHHNYDFVTIDALYRDVLPVIRRHGLSWTVRLLNKKRAGDDIEFDVKIDLHWRDGTTYAEYDEFFMVHPYIGAQTTGSAKSYASKAFMREEFKIATGEPDADSQRQPGRRGAREFTQGVTRHMAEGGYGKGGPRNGDGFRPAGSSSAPGEEPPPVQSPDEYGRGAPVRRRPDGEQRMAEEVDAMRQRKASATAPAAPTAPQESREDRERRDQEIERDLLPPVGPAPLTLPEQINFEARLIELLGRMKDDMSVRRLWESRKHILAPWKTMSPERYVRVLDHFTKASQAFGAPPPQDRGTPKFHRPPTVREHVEPPANVVRLVPRQEPTETRRLRKIAKDPPEA